MQHAYLIDGYNLIHALGMIQRQMPAGGLEASRRRLLDFLSAAFTTSDADVTIVFDAKGAPAGGKRLQEHAGLHICFAPRAAERRRSHRGIDRASTHPDHLTVISNDMRLQTAARRQGARAWSHEDLLDYLDKKNVQNAPPTSDEATEKADHTSPTEIQHWLREFKALEDDPKLKEFFDLDKFE